MKSPKFKNNKRTIGKDDVFAQIIREYESILELLSKHQFGKSEHLANDLYPKYRALLCSGRNLKPLLIRALDDFEMSFDFYTNIKPQINENHNDSLFTKSWSPLNTSTYKTKISLSDYLTQDFYYNSIEERHISRDEAIRKIADKEGSHYDLEVDLFSEYLSNTKTLSSGIEFSQKELLMWDLGLVILWNIQRFKLGLRKSQFIENSEYSDSRKQEYFYNVEGINSHYHKKILFPDFGLKVMLQRACLPCELPMEKIDEVTYKCPKCGAIEEL